MPQQLDLPETSYAEEKEIQWHVNTGSNKIHAKRLPGRFRTLKWISAAPWLIFFLAPYLRWDDRQALLFDIPARQFHLFGITVHPQDIWVLTFVLLFFATLLLISTLIAGRAFCGYACFQTVWTDLFTWIEDKLEGQPKTRYQLDAAPWGIKKLSIKFTKHTLWILIGALTGLSFSAWFTDAYQLWHDYFNLQAHKSAWWALALLTVGTYLFAGFMREQMCLWLCPYSRLQGVMYDKNTLLPAYDIQRGEPRTKVNRKNQHLNGDCVDCDQCLAVCPTGIDIREGQQAGCITCGLCIDACDMVMKKLNRPIGLVRYASLNQIENRKEKRVLKRPQVWLAIVLISISIFATAYGLNNMSPAEINIVPSRQPLYVMMSDGSVQNRYQVRIFNKTDNNQLYRIIASDKLGLISEKTETELLVKPGKMATAYINVRISKEALTLNTTPITFMAHNLTTKGLLLKYESVFKAPINN